MTDLNYQLERADEAARRLRFAVTALTAMVVRETAAEKAQRYRGAAQTCLDAARTLFVTCGWLEARSAEVADETEVKGG